MKGRGVADGGELGLGHGQAAARPAAHGGDAVVFEQAHRIAEHGAAEAVALPERYE
jgi:hypothetical protein